MNRASLPLILLPGVLSDATVWRGQTVASELPVLTAVVDYRDCRTLAAMAERVLETAPPRFALAGHSMGARVALEVVRRAPERVERLALLDTGVHPVQPGEDATRMALVELGEREGAAALVDAWLPPMLHPASRADAAIVAPLRAMALGCGVATFRAQTEAMLARPDAREVLPMIACPTLVATAESDEWSPPAQHRAIAAAIPGATLTIFADGGHMAPFEAPRPVNAALRRWLQ